LPNNGSDAEHIYSSVYGGPLFQVPWLQFQMYLTHSAFYSISMLHLAISFDISE